MTNREIYLLLFVLFSILVWSGSDLQKAFPGFKSGTSRYGLRRSSLPKLPLSTMRWLDRRSDGRKGDSILLGKVGLVSKYLSPSDSLLVFGPTRSGKTLTLAFPILSEFAGPAVVTSVKRDLYDLTLSARRSSGECVIFDLSDPDSSPWNLFSLIDNYKTARKVSDSLCRVSQSASPEIGFWSQLASKTLAPLLLAAKAADLTLSRVLPWVESQDFEEAFEILTMTSLYEPRRALESVINLDQRTVSSVIATLLSLLEPYGDPLVSSLLCADGIDLYKVLDRRSSNTLYICSPLFGAERFLGIYELFLRKIFEIAYQGKTGDPRILFLLDELANVAPLPELDRVASTCGGFGIVLISIFQDLTQMENIYGGRAGTVMNNHRSKLCLSGVTDLATLNYVEKMVSRWSVSEDSVKRITKLRRGYGLYIPSSKNSETLRLRPFPRATRQPSRLHRRVLELFQR